VALVLPGGQKPHVTKWRETYRKKKLAKTDFTVRRRGGQVVARPILAGVTDAEKDECVQEKGRGKNDGRREGKGERPLQTKRATHNKNRGGARVASGGGKYGKDENERRTLTKETEAEKKKSQKKPDSVTNLGF